MYHSELCKENYLTFSFYFADDVFKKRWANIRDQFKKHRNKRKTKSGQGAVTIKNIIMKKN